MSSKSKTKTKVTPYDPAAIAAGQGALNSGFDAATATQAQFSPVINAAIARIGQQIAAPPAYQTDARQTLDNTIRGDFLAPDTNPWAKGIADLIAKRTQGGYNASFGAAGRSHGGLAALLSSQGVGDALGQFYGNLYEQERGRQQQAVGMAPAFNQDEYTGINNLLPAVSGASNMPLGTANLYAGGLCSLIAPYTTTNTTTKKGGLGQTLATGLGLASMIASPFFPPAGMLGGAAGAAGAAGPLGAISNPFGSGGLSGMMKVLG